MAVGNRQWTRAVRVPEALSVAGKCLYIFGVVNVIVLAVLIVSWAAGGSTSTFMWVRAVILLALTPLLLVLVRSARRGSQSAVDRVRLVSTVLPVAIVVVDLIPGMCPDWYAAMQGAGALALVPVAVLLWRRTSRPVAAETSRDGLTGRGAETGSAAARAGRDDGGTSNG